MFGKYCRRSQALPFLHYGPSRAGDVRDSQADTQAAERDLGHAPQFSLEDGLRRTLDWYRTRGVIVSRSHRAGLARLPG